MSPLIGHVGESVDAHVVEDLVRPVQQPLPDLPPVQLVPVPEPLHQL